MKNDRLAWPIALLLLTVLVPSAGVVWMMREAVRNERMATSQRLMDAYQAQLQFAVGAVQDGWSDRLAASADVRNRSDAQARSASAAAFHAMVQQGNVDAVLIRDKQGHIIYPEPSASSPVHADESNPQWLQARNFEFVDQQFADAARLYERLSVESSEEVLQSRARQGQARCLMRLDRRDEAIEVLELQRGQPKIRDHDGRSFAAMAEMRLLEILDQKSDRWKRLAESLSDRLGDYGDEPLPSAQRLFLMNQLKRVSSEPLNWPTYAAETLANRAVLVKDIQDVATQLQATALADVWARATPDGRVIELYRTASVMRALRELASSQPLPRGLAFAPTPPNEPSNHLADASLGPELIGWRLGLSITQSGLVDEVSVQRRAVHVWIALLVVAVTCMLGWLLLDTLRRRLRLAQLKNDLVATVTHELKTPLSSIRLLVDTLLHDEDESQSNESQINTQDYLKMISHENARLTRLVDNFLTFSRIESGQANADFRSIDIQDVIDKAVLVFREHIGREHNGLQVHHGPVAMVSGDFDALVTAIVNLLENAWKYSDDPRQIDVNTSNDDAKVTVTIRDNGIGMSTSTRNQAFDRFYQADQRVARTRGGCGLGLSIVHAIVLSHGGEIRVESTPNVGSTFTVSFAAFLPARNAKEVAK